MIQRHPERIGDFENPDQQELRADGECSKVKGDSKGETAAIDKNTRGTNAYISGGLSMIAQDRRGPRENNNAKSPSWYRRFRKTSTWNAASKKRRAGKKGCRVTQEI